MPDSLFPYYQQGLSCPFLTRLMMHYCPRGRAGKPKAGPFPTQGRLWKWFNMDLAQPGNWGDMERDAQGLGATRGHGVGWIRITPRPKGPKIFFGGPGARPRPKESFIHPDKDPVELQGPPFPGGFPRAEPNWPTRGPIGGWRGPQGPRAQALKGRPPREGPPGGWETSQKTRGGPGKILWAGMGPRENGAKFSGVKGPRTKNPRGVRHPTPGVWTRGNIHPPRHGCWKPPHTGKELLYKAGRQIKHKV